MIKALSERERERLERESVLIVGAAEHLECLVLGCLLTKNEREKADRTETDSA